MISVLCLLKQFKHFKISDDDRFSKMVCFRCEQQLKNAYHFRQLAESSSKHFAAILSTNLISPRILNSEKGSIGKASTNHNIVADEQWIEITNENDVTLKSETITDEETTCTSPVVYMVQMDVNGADEDIEVRPRIVIDSKSASNDTDPLTLNSTYVDIEDATNEYSENDQDEHTDAISFLLNNKHLKKKDDCKKEAYHSRKFECTVCAKRFLGKSNLIDHLNYHANIRNFQCTFCDKSFVQSGSLKSHMRTHTAEKPFTCSYCDKGFGQKSALTVHIRTHTHERKYVCTTCSKAFMTTGDLVKHKLIHESIKKFSCDICGMRSAQKVNIKKHKLRVHRIPEEERN